MKWLLKRLRFDTPFNRFSSLLLITGVPFFCIRCILRRHELSSEPWNVVFIAMRDLVETVLLWVFNELFLDKGSRRKDK